jgi:hypothetical protein
MPVRRRRHTAIPTVTATIAINAIGYTIEVDTVVLCNAVSIGQHYLA